MDSSPQNNEASRADPSPDNPAAVRTPRNRRAISVEPPSSRRSALRTPLDRTASRDLLNSVRRGVSAADGRRQNAPTPHATAARRALEQRRTALLTPGRARRQSLLEQRETPMGILGKLSRVLANDTEPFASSSSSPQGRPSSVRPASGNGDDDDDDDDELPILPRPPRPSLPPAQSENSDSPPPPSRGPDETMTVPGVELPRRALSEQPTPHSRSSLNGLRRSDLFVSDDDTGPLQRPSDFFPGLLEDIQARPSAGGDTTFSRIDRDDRRSTIGRQSEIGLDLPPDVADQTTFVLSPPAVDGDATSPLQERSIAGVSDRGAAGTAGLGEVTVISGVGKDDDTAIYDRSMPALLEDEPEEGLFTAGNVNVVVEEEEEEEEQPEEEEEPVGEVDSDPEQHELDTSAAAAAAQPRPVSGLKKRQRRISRHGIEYPPLPPSFVKRVAQTALHSSGLSNHRVSTDTLTALTQASEWFFEQLGDDLGAYASHAKRKIIEESDMATLMRRQRQITSDATLFSLAQRHLPRELLQELKMPPPPGGKIPRKRRREEETEESSETTSTPSS